MPTNNAANFGTGTSGQILTSNGVGVAPTFQAATSLGNLILISSQTASSSAALTFTGLGTAGYPEIMIILSSIVPATSAATLNMVVSNNNGSTYASSGYQSGIQYVAYNSTTFANGNSTTFYKISYGIDATAGFSGTFFMHNINLGTYSTLNGSGMNYKNDGTGTYNLTSAGYCTTTGTNAIQFAMSSGNIASGTITVFGLLE